jgi:DNA gyrase subunit A
MIHPDDVAAWIAQVRQHPEAAPGIIEALAERLVELDKQNEVLRDELVRLSRSQSVASEEGRVAALSRRVQVLERQLGQPESAEQSMLVLTLDGRGARLALPSADVWEPRADPALAASHLRPRHLLTAAENEDLLLLTDKGRATRISVVDIASVEAPIGYVSLLPGVNLDLDESVSVAVPLPSSFGQLTLVTRKGYARSFRRAEVDSLLERRLPLHSSPVAGDYPAFGLLSDGKGQLLVATQMGKGVRFPETAIGVQSEPAIKLDRGDVVAGVSVVDDATGVALVGADGVGVRREMGGFGAHSTAGNRGKILTRIGEIVAAAVVEPESVLWLLTGQGKLHVVRAANVPAGPGAGSGKALLKLGEDRIVAMAVS